jgi:hypothetical protein
LSENGIDKNNVIGRGWVYFGIRAEWMSREEKRGENANMLGWLDVHLPSRGRREMLCCKMKLSYVHEDGS